jgi:hypothetical protein
MGEIRARRAGLPLDGPATRADEAGDWTTTQIETRYGCFLPDLTGLARDLPAASLPRPLYQVHMASRQDRSSPILARGRRPVPVSRPR